MRIVIVLMGEFPLEIKNDSVTRYLVGKGPDILILIAFFRPQVESTPVNSNLRNAHS